MISPWFSRKVPSNATLLLGLLVLIIVAPLVPPGQTAPLMELFFDLVLLTGVASMATLGRHGIPFGILTLVTLAVRWADLMAGETALTVSAFGLSLAWLGYMIYLLVPTLYGQRDVTINTIYGAIVVYLLISVAFSFVFGLIELQSPGAFSGIPQDQARGPDSVSTALLYFSLTSLTTMGYGDIVPIDGLARSLSVLEGAIGQLYLAVMIARLVGLHAATERARD